MNKTSDTARNDWAVMREDIDNAIALLRRYNENVGSYIVDVVAAVCDVRAEDIMSGICTAHITHARWLYWYSMKYMTKSSSLSIAIASSKLFNKTYTEQAVAHSVSKMSSMIEMEQEWARRWAVVRRVIRLSNDDEDGEKPVIVIEIPKELKKKLTIQIKEK